MNLVALIVEILEMQMGTVGVEPCVAKVHCAELDPVWHDVVRTLVRIDWMPWGLVIISRHTDND